VLEELATHEQWRGVKLGLASRTDCVQDAHELMRMIMVTPSLCMADLFAHKQVGDLFCSSIIFFNVLSMHCNFKKIDGSTN
jgi:hypothetical protein